MILATLKDGTVVSLDAVPGPDAVGAVALAAAGPGGSLDDLVQSGDFLRIRDAVARGRRGLAVTAADLTTPIRRPPKIVAIGLNYRDHASESEMELPSHPLVFTKFSSAIVGPTDDIVIPTELSSQVDFEVELGVVIGATARYVPRERALDYVFGYTILNDVSARDVQFADQQWVRAKSLDTFCPLGPAIVTAEDVPDPQELRLSCSVNGVTMQQASTGDMIFAVADLISILSASFTLQPGDVIASGTPSGVGFARRPPVYLHPGDEVVSDVEGLGQLRNRVRARALAEEGQGTP
jgi:2-keto-4-pentenoate hydratase/2-oxohepta-3-ene-1,7-dioic acid hydratase in catechol pathway